MYKRQEQTAAADVVILVTGDGDFSLLVDTLRQNHGKTVEVYGVPQLSAISLVNSASHFIAIDEELLL